MSKSQEVVTPSKDSIDEEFESRIAAGIVDAMKPAVVTLTVDDRCFRKILKPTLQKGSLTVQDPNTKATMTVSDHPRVYIRPGQPERLRIKRGGATIRLKIEPDDYYPIGVAFQLKDGQANRNQQDRIGLLNFESSHMPMDKQTLLITDRFKDADSDDLYKFSVIIQRVMDGEIGIIDPDIVHES